VSRDAAVVLAAGEASRFGAPKQRLLLPEVLVRLGSAPVDDVVVVAGAYPLEPPAGLDVRVVDCPGWERGPGASLRCGLGALDEDVDRAVVVLADGPDLAPEAVARVLAAQRESGAPVVAASYGGERGHPLVLAREAWDAVPDVGLRFRDIRLVPCDDLGGPGDVDTPADVPARLRPER
jgi:CTP:molybdopterin cytidylyltransferase MocA